MQTSEPYSENIAYSGWERQQNRRLKNRSDGQRNPPKKSVTTISRRYGGRTLLLKFKIGQNTTDIFWIYLNISSRICSTATSSYSFGLSLQSGVATAYHLSPSRPIFNVRLLCTNFSHIFLHCI